MRYDFGRRVTALALAVALFLIPAAGASAAAAPPHLTVMSRNLYLGADLLPVVTAGSQQELFVRATETWQQVLASNFAERADALAAEVVATKPDLIGLQEVALWRTDTPVDGPATPAETVALDFLDMFLQALSDRGLDYTVAAQVENFDGEVPTLLGHDVRYTDHDVILTNGDVATGNPQGGNFSVGLPLPPLFGGGIVARGWTSIDATVAGETLRFVNTHPEAWGPDVIRLGQTAELLGGPLATALPVVLVGDLNTPPGSGAYNLLNSAGFVDAWRRPTPGLTCCQASDLRNTASELTTRIDYVMSRGELRAVAPRVVGATRGSMTPSGLWPSDHAGVVAKILLQRRD